MPSYAEIELEKSGLAELPLELDSKHEGYVYGQSFTRTWEILDIVAKLNGLQPLSSFYAECDIQKQWYDSAVGLQTVSGLLNKYFTIIGCGTVTFLSSESKRLDCELSGLPQDEAILKDAIRSKELFNYAMWDLRAYELILRGAVENGECFRIVVN
ncbi:hypothetical protein Osc7112_0752 [Oscillatoria nigro-viridis PCC 7112]|uniref:Uncharacterized protein n=1 Tax=Phormidium nigroviride PCC 7112 TaxID=179408 RepID=K9VCV7_9CYAN|nr:hypothetical protein [Oscillatoria nigro-viridis]AFZ05339.1 hypothetical protein Osc7112_0752 [Oscillatoria nigro-viridis PCC 7112]